VSGLSAIALGSNLDSGFGDREANLREAIRRVGELGVVKAVSSFYDTEPVVYREQPRFLNAAILLATELEPAELMRALLGVELAMGRDRSHTVTKGPRLIDLDLLSYTLKNGSAVVMSTEELTLPHPSMEERRFVLEPLAEIAPQWVHPNLRITVRELLNRLG
jgi:2-amino-4-hydroxy-6-hydroxymethyldihydropteridine diphosphokinase